MSEKVQDSAVSQDTSVKCLSTLVCGEEQDLKNGGEFSQILLHLKGTLDTALGELVWLAGESEHRLSLYGPFLARSILEVGMTAIAGRLDPTRLLVVKRTQEHANYTPEIPWKTSIQWRGDVIPENKAKDWVEDVSYKEITKAIFGDYYGRLYWAICMKVLADSETEGGAWLAGLKAMGADAFVPRRREEANKLYSLASKGIHSEFVVPPGSIYDRATIQNVTDRSIQVLAEVGVLVNLIPHVPHRVNIDVAVKLLNEAESIEVFK